MALSCLLFTSDEGTAQSVRQALTELGVESEHCAVAVEAVQKVTNNPFNLLIVDWDNQTEAAFLVKTARERKASERPLTLAIVSHDLNVPQALQAGANSILRKPIVDAQVRDSLTSACGLLRSRDASLAGSAQAAAAAASSSASDGKKTLRAGEFLQSATAPGTQFVTEADVQGKIQRTIEEAAVAQVNPLKDLEPMAAAVETKEAPAPPSNPASSEPRGLEWYMKARGATLPPPPSPAKPAAPELLGYDQTPSSGEPHTNAPVENSEPKPADSASGSPNPDQKAESALFAYMSGKATSESEPAIAKSRPWLRQLIFVGPLIAVCAFAYATVPPARWRQNLQIVASNAVHFAHNWLNPQAATPTQVPTTHENFGLAGDEYKLPVAQNIPDATTDPNQIRVVPVIDPTAKQPKDAASNSTAEDPTASDASGPNSAQELPPNSNGQAPAAVQIQEAAQPGSSSPAAGEASPASAPVTPPNVASEPAPVAVPAGSAAPVHRDPMQPVSTPKPRPQSAPVETSLKPALGIPSSLKSQMAPATPDPNGNRPVEAALPSIEPVDVPEAAARSLLTEQPDLPYPATAKGQHGTVVLQVLINRDGSVQDAKFLQGALAFARAATDDVRQWHFKPYNLNGRPVSIRTTLTLTFNPAS